jgi:hypothetical protein
MERPTLARLFLPVTALVIAPVILLVMVSSGWALFGLAGYLVIFFLMAVWNFFAAWRALANRWGTFGGLRAPRNLAVVMAFGFVFVMWGPMIYYMWGSDRTLYALAYAVAAVLTAYLLRTAPETRRLRNYLFLVYNIVGALAVTAWAYTDVSAGGTVLLAPFAQGWGITQVLLWIWGAAFAPIFFLPPMLVFELRVSVEEESDTDVELEERTGIMRIAQRAPDIGEATATTSQRVITVKPRRSGLRRSVSFGMDVFMGAMVVFLVLFSVVGAINVASWASLPPADEVEFGQREDMEFAAIGRAFTDRRFAVDDWGQVVTEEIRHAKTLGLDHIRYDLHMEFIDNFGEMLKLERAIALIRDEGLDVMLSPFGSERWEGDPPSFDDLVTEIQRETYLLVEVFQPAWVLPFFEPNGQVMVNLGTFAPVEDWIPVINETATRVRELSNHTRVLIEVAVEPEQGVELVRALSAPGLVIDAIGVDLYPISAPDLDKLDAYREAATNDDLGFWLGEFGVETVMSGPAAQAKALATVLERATNGLNATGVCVWSLLDDTVVPSNLGIVSRNGEPKEAYRVLERAIDEIRGDGT